MPLMVNGLQRFFSLLSVSLLKKEWDFTEVSEWFIRSL